MEHRLHHESKNNAIFKKMEDWVNLFIKLDEKDDSFASKALFFLAFGTWIAAWLLKGHSTAAGILSPFVNYSYVHNACLIVLAIREVLFGKWNRLTFLGFCLFAFLAYMANEAVLRTVFDAVCFTFCARNVPFRTIARFVFIELTILFLLVVTCSLIGVIPDTIINRSNRIRHHLGFAHPNTCCAIAFFLLCIWVYLREKEFGVIDLVATIALFAVLFALTDSRTSFIMACALAICAFTWKFIPRWIFRSRIFMLLSISSVALCAIIGISLALFYDPSIGWMKALNSLLSGRLGLGHNLIEQHGIHLFAQQIDYSKPTTYDVKTASYISTGKTQSIIIDCTYVKLLESCGLLFLLITLGLTIAVGKKTWSNQQWYLLLVIAFIAIHGMSENYCMYAQYDVFLLLIGQLFYPHRKFTEPAAL